jgi:hypothetical protein
MLCQKCGKEVSENWKFCKYCGAPINRKLSFESAKVDAGAENYKQAEIHRSEALEKARKLFRDDKRSDASKVLLNAGFSSSQIEAMFEVFAREPTAKTTTESTRKAHIPQDEEEELICLQPTIMVDFDGTLVTPFDKLPERWTLGMLKSYKTSEPNFMVIDIIHAFVDHFKPIGGLRVLLLTGRREEEKEEIYEWLDKWNLLSLFGNVFFMPNNIECSTTKIRAWKLEKIKKIDPDNVITNDDELIKRLKLMGTPVTDARECYINDGEEYDVDDEEFL